MNRVLALVFTVVLTLNYSSFFTGQDLQTSFSDYDEVVSYYAPKVDGGSFNQKNDRYKALYLLSDIYINQYSEISSSSKSTIETLCYKFMHSPNYSWIKSIWKAALAASGVFSDDEATGLGSIMEQYRSKYSNLNDVELTHQFCAGLFYENTLNNINNEHNLHVSNNLTTDLHSSAETASPYHYFYTYNGVNVLLSGLRDRCSNLSQYNDIYNKITSYLRSKPESFIICYYSSYSNTVCRIVFLDPTPFVFIGTFPNGKTKSVSLQARGTDWGYQPSFKASLLAINVTDTALNVSSGTFGQNDTMTIDAYSNAWVWQNRTINNHTFSGNFVVENDLGNPSFQAPGSYNYTYGVSHYVENVNCNIFTASLQRHIYFDTIDDYKAYTLYSRPFYVSNVMPSSTVIEDVDNYNTYNYETYEYINNNIYEGISPEELQNIIDNFIRQLNEIGEVVNEGQKTQITLLQKIDEKLAGILVLLGIQTISDDDNPPVEEDSDSQLRLSDVLIFLVYLILFIQVLGDFVMLFVALTDWLYHLWAIPASPGPLAGNEVFVGVHTILHGGTALGLEQPILIFGVLSLHDFMVIIFEIAIIGAVVGLMRKKLTSIQIPDVR